MSRGKTTTMMGSKERHFSPLIKVSLEELVPQESLLWRPFLLRGSRKGRNEVQLRIDIVQQGKPNAIETCRFLGW